MHSGPVPADGGWDEDPARRAAESAAWEPVITRPDPMTEEEWLASLDATAREDEPPEDEEEPAGEYGWSEIEARPAAQFATGRPFDVMPGRADLAQFADEAAGADDSYTGASDDELLGVLRAWDRVEAHAAARKFAAVAELMRRRPAPGTAVEGPARIPAECEEFTVCELVTVLALSRWDADGMLSFAYDLAVRLPGTRAAFADGVVNQEKAEIIARATACWTPEEARAAEALVLGRAGRLTPAGLRSAIARAVIQVAPDKARKRREKAAKEARVERWAEVSGNAGLAGRELPPAQVLAADQKITAWARQLKRPAWRAPWTSCAPAPTWTCCSAPTPAPATRHRPGRHRPGRHRPGRHRPGRHRPGRPGRRRRPWPGQPRAGLRRGRSRPGSPARSTSPSRWPPCSSWPTGPARSPASAPSTRGWPAT